MQSRVRTVTPIAPLSPAVAPLPVALLSVRQLDGIRHANPAAPPWVRMGRVKGVSLFPLHFQVNLLAALEKKWGWFFCIGSFVFKSGFFRSSLSPSVALSRARPIPPANPKTVVPSKDYSHGGGLGLPLFMKGDGQKTHSRAVKKSI